MYVVFMHGLLVQVELYGTWFLEVAQHQLVLQSFYYHHRHLTSFPNKTLDNATE